jgi:hypothetical protein
MFKPNRSNLTMKLVHLANLSGGALFTYIGFANLHHAANLETLAGGMLLTGAGCLYVYAAVHCLLKRV